MTKRDDKHNGPKIKQTYRFWLRDIAWIRERYDNINLAVRRAVAEFVERQKRKEND